jgi:hypothetical protein
LIYPEALDEYMELGRGYWIWITNPEGDTLSAITTDDEY